jgi:hypothetical protein
MTHPEMELLDALNGSLAGHDLAGLDAWIVLDAAKTLGLTGTWVGEHPSAARDALCAVLFDGKPFEWVRELLASSAGDTAP